MKNYILSGLVIAVALVLSSCSGKMIPLTADNFTVTPNPLVAEKGVVPVTINGLFPEKFMNRKAVVTVTPVLRYATGQTVGQPAMFQGEKVMGNNQVISYRVGGNYTMRNTFSYTDAMQKSDLYLTFDVVVGNKSYKVPDVKVAEGIIATSELARRTVMSANPAVAPDNFQHIIKQKQEASIQFLVNQANLRTSELENVSVQQFLATLKDIQTDQENKALEDIEISSYASPEGSFKVNEALAEKRGSNTKDYINKELKDKALQGEVSTKYTAEDWEGFQQLVSQSNIQDKDVILRVLSMYEDPEQREQQIRNISVAYGDLTKEILPQLRRSRILLNYDLIGRSDETIMAQFKEDASKLSVEELIYATGLTEDVATQKAILNKTMQLYPSDYRSYNNLAALAYQNGDYTTALEYANKALSLNPNAPEANVNRGLVCLVAGNVNEAAQSLAKSSGTYVTNEALGNLSLLQGNYAQALKYLQTGNTNSAGLAKLLNKDYLGAATTLNAVKNPNGMTSYLKAIIAARTNNNDLVVNNLKTAIQLDPSLAAYAANDLEFAKLRSDAAFNQLVK